MFDRLRLLDMTPPGTLWPHPVEFTAVENLRAMPGNNPGLVMNPATPLTPGQGAPRSIRNYMLATLDGKTLLLLTRP